MHREHQFRFRGIENKKSLQLDSVEQSGLLIFSKLFADNFTDATFKRYQGSGLKRTPNRRTRLGKTRLSRLRNHAMTAQVVKAWVDVKGIFW